jgi:ferredoxin
MRLRTGRRLTATVGPSRDHDDLDGRPALDERRAKGNDMKVSVDFDVCASTGACMQVCPEVFEVRSDGYLYILQENPGDDVAEKVREAADLCPTAAISIEE